MSNTPQPIAVHSGTAFQNFRKGECGPYRNPILYTAPNAAMTAIMIRRTVNVGTATVTLVNLDDVDVTTFTPTSVTSYELDSEGENYALVLGAGNWAGAASVQTDKFYYFRIESGTEEYFTDEFYFMPGVDGFPEACEGEIWAKYTYSINGANIYSGKTVVNPAVPVLAFPDAVLTFFLFLDAVVYQPSWEQEEIGEPDFHGQVVQDRLTLSKRWRLGGKPVSEAIYDALNVSALSALAFVGFNDGTSLSPMRKISVEADWNETGCTANVGLLFETSYFVKQGCI